MLRLTRNELLIGFTISVILSLFANFTSLIHHYDMEVGSTVTDVSYTIRKHELWFSIFWFFFFSFSLFILYRWIYRWGYKAFQRKEVKTIGVAMGFILVVAFGLYKTYPIINKAIKGKIYNTSGYAVSGYNNDTGRPIIVTENPPGGLDATTDSVATPDKVWLGVNTVFFSPAYSNPLLIEHIFVLLTTMLSLLLLHLLDKRQEMKLEYEKMKVEKLQNSYNALMGQINPHFFFNSLNGLNSLIRIGEQERTLEYLNGLSDVFRYILQSNHKTLVSLDEELQFINAYTYLLSVRYENKLFFSIRIAEGYLQKRLPILSLLPLIENAVKHNIISMQYPLRIDICTTSEDLLVVSNLIQPKMEEYVCNGIGLKNLQGRYQMLVGRDIHIDNSNGYFKVSLPLLNALE